MPDIVNLEAHYIGSPAPGVYLHQVPNAAMKVLEDLINATWDEGLATKDEFSAKITAIMDDFLAIVNAPHVTSGSVTVPTITEPAVDIPAAITVDDIYDQWETRYLELASWLATRFAEFRSVYFPDDSAALAAVLDRMELLAATSLPTIAGGTVTPPTVSDIAESTDISSSAVSVGAFTDTASGTTLVPGTVSPPSVAEPALTIPTDADISAIMSVFDDAYADLVLLLETKFQSYRTQFYANEGDVYDSAEAWLIDSIANAEVALPSSIATQIWGNDQARILVDKSRAQDAVIAQFAARRFPLPPGAAVSAVLQIEQKAQDELAESSRKIAEMSVGLMQTVLEKALQLRAAAMQAANEYIKALASGPEIASRIAGIGYDAQSKLISSVASLLNARSEVAKLALQANTTTIQVALEAGKSNQAVALDADKTNLAAALDVVKLGLQADTTTAQLALEADKANQVMALEADKANLGVSVDVAKMTLQASTTTVQIAFEAAKANQMVALESVKLSISGVIELRSKSMQAAVDYIKALASGPDMASRMSNVGYDAQSKLITSAAQMYNARSNAAETISKVTQYNNSTALEAAVKNQMSDLAIIENRVKALLSEAQSIAQMTTALFNNLNVQAALRADGSTTISQSNEF